MEENDWFVRPREPYLTAVERRDGPEASASVFFTAGGLALVFIAVPLIRSLEPYGSAVAVLAVVGVPVLTGVAVMYLWRKVRRELWYDRQEAEAKDNYRRLKDRAREEAASTTKELHDLCKQANTKLRILPRFLKQAESHLGQAKQEFEASAFSPFWEQIKSALEDLARLQIGISDLVSDLKRYRETLAGRDHTFPDSLPLSGSVPNIGGATRKLRRLVRMGQTDPNFALIWEHHKEQAILLEGFETLSEGIENLGSRTVTSLVGLEAGVVTSAHATSAELAESIDRSLQEVRKAIEEKP